MSDTGTKEGFTPQQKSELSSMIAEALKGSGGGKAPDPPKGEPAVSDDEWSRMGPAARESMIERSVRSILEQFGRDDKIDSLERELAELKDGKGKASSEPEKVPTIVDRFRVWLWGAPEPDEPGQQ